METERPLKVLLLFLKRFLFIFRERGRRKKEGERNVNVWLPLECPLLGTWPATQACALTGIPTSNILVLRPALNPLSHTSQGCLLPPFFSYTATKISSPPIQSLHQLLSLPLCPKSLIHLIRLMIHEHCFHQVIFLHQNILGTL